MSKNNKKFCNRSKYKSKHRSSISPINWSIVDNSIKKYNHFSIYSPNTPLLDFIYYVTDHGKIIYLHTFDGVKRIVDLT